MKTNFPSKEALSSGAHWLWTFYHVGGLILSFYVCTRQMYCPQMFRRFKSGILQLQETYIFIEKKVEDNEMRVGILDDYFSLGFFGSGASISNCSTEWDILLDAEDEQLSLWSKRKKEGPHFLDENKSPT